MDGNVAAADLTESQNCRNLSSIGDLVLNVDHLAIAVRDLPTAISWYVGLGFKLLQERVTEGEYSGMISAVLRAGRVIVVLVQGTSAKSQVSRFVEHFGAGVQHIAFEVADLDSALSKMRDVGAVPDARSQDVGIRQAFLRRDPGSGVRVELIERRGGDFTDSSIRQLFLEFERQDLF